MLILGLEYVRVCLCCAGVYHNFGIAMKQMEIIGFWGSLLPL